MSKFFETHAHLSDGLYDDDRDVVIERAFMAGLNRIIEIADGPAEWPKAQALAERYQGRMWWSAGIHPYYSDQGTKQVFDGLKACAAHPQCVAIGEVGLDYAKSTISPDVQKACFVSAIELALALDKPLVIHCRNAYADMIPLLKKFFPRAGKPPGVIHCFSGTDSDARAVLQMGFFVGVDGPLTYPSAKVLRGVMGSIPLERIVLETDSPYLPPQTHRGKRNEPAHLIAVAEKLAEIKSVSVDDVARVATANACTLFGLNPV